MKTLFFIKIGMLLAVLVGCAAKYRPIEPLTVKFDDRADSLANGDILVSWEYDVLKNAGNKKNARKERRHEVSLLAVRVSNFTGDTLFLPENLSVISEKDTLEMLFSDDAYDELRQTIADNSFEGDNYDEGWLIALGIDFYNTAVQTKANLRFAKELDKFYLTPCFVAPGKTTIGLLALPVKKKKPLRFELRD